MPLKGGIVLDLSAMDRVIWAKPGVLRAQAGARLIAIDEQTRREVGGELRFHPSTKRTATIGGFIAGGSAGAGSCMWGVAARAGGTSWACAWSPWKPHPASWNCAVPRSTRRTTPMARTE
jgi:FAD/FMN-containing dehydrogenase